MASPNGQRNPLTTFRSSAHICYATMVGGGAAADLSVAADAATNGGGEIVSATRTGAGTYNIVFRHLWPQLLQAPDFSFVDTGGTNGRSGQCTAIDVTAGTATFVFSVNGTPTDVTTTTTIYANWAVRTSSKN